MFIFRTGLLVAVPTDYAAQPDHVLLVKALTAAARYVEAVAVVEQHSTGWRDADILAGVPWFRRFLTTTARLWAGSPRDRALAARGWRALMHALNGTRPRVGRHREPPLSAKELERAADALTRWRVAVDQAWGRDRASMAVSLLALAAGHFRVSAAHRRATRALLRRRGLRKRDVVQAFASWETGLPLRRLRSATSVTDLVYA